ncbi:MAG: addiction module protein [Polaromonas sp.]
MQTTDIVAEACKLGWASRLELVQTILQTMQPQDAKADHEGEAEFAWRQEVLRRVTAYRSGREPGIPAAEVLGHF